MRHINQFGTPTSPLMEISCTAENAENLREFFGKHEIEVFDGQLKPCIDPAIKGTKETDNRKIAIRLESHFVRILLAWWKPDHYIYSPDTRLYYRRTLLQLIPGNGKLFQWPAFLKAVHIDGGNV